MAFAFIVAALALPDYVTRPRPESDRWRIGCSLRLPEPATLTDRVQEDVLACMTGLMRWLPPPDDTLCAMIFRSESNGGAIMTPKVSMLAIARAKGSCQVCAVATDGAVPYDRVMPRIRYPALLAEPADVVTMEADAMSHHL